MKKPLLYLFCILLLTSCGHKGKLQSNIGLVFGTYYSFNYYASENYQADFDSIFAVVNHSLSTFDSTSIISEINRSASPVRLDEHFIKIMDYSRYVSEQSGGAFDLTVAPLVNLWGFGYDPLDKSTFRSEEMVDSVRQIVGFDKISIVDSMLVKADPRMKLDASAIAKGYACDLIAECLKSKGVRDFMVDIGGEVVCGGCNPDYKPWRIGIVSPVDDSTQTINDYEQVVELSDRAIATSGNYRQFYITKERKVSHTIDPRTGYPAESKVLSASVLADECAIADAYATSFMVLGDTTAIKDIIKASKYDIEAYIIVDNDGSHISRHYTR
ncbi:MAG: FAD:protein FMN transferase [Paludibacteraceae bacterium]|nr:FAD:protein FMN transferase [Paludibacteraceae bacterium]